MKNRIRVLRAEKEISQEELANLVHVSRQTINSIENGKFNPSVILALKLADCFDTKVEELFKLENDD